MKICLTEDKIASLKEKHYGKYEYREDFVHYYCDNCGSEIYALIDIEHDSKRKNAELVQLKTCPNCKNNLNYTDGYYCYAMYDRSEMTKLGPMMEENRDEFTKKKDRQVYSDGRLNYSEKSIFKHMEKIRAEKEKQIVDNKVVDFCNKYEVSNISNNVNYPAENIKTDINKLKEYIQNLIILETNIYSLTQRLSALYFQQIVSNRDVENAKGTFIHQKDIDLEKAIAYHQECSNKYSKAKSKKIEQVTIKKPKEPTQPVLAKAGLFNKKKVEEENNALLAQYERAMSNYKQQLADCEQRKIQKEQELQQEYLQNIETAKNEMEKAKHKVDRLKQEIEIRKEVPSGMLARIMAPKTFVDDEITTAETTLQALFDCRNQLYSYNVIFEKYRNMVALVTIYEYLMAERCTELTGPNGAYNIYEAELRSNTIVDQLSQVIESLEQIKSTQSLMYKELKTINKNLDTLNTTMSSMLSEVRKISANTSKMSDYLQDISSHAETLAQNSTVIAYNSEVTAYYSKMNAELTNALGFMVALK